MSLLTSPGSGVHTDITDKAHRRMAAGAPIWEVDIEDMPLWLLRGVRRGAAPIRTVFLGPWAGMVVHVDGAWTLRSRPVL